VAVVLGVAAGVEVSVVLEGAVRAAVEPAGDGKIALKKIRGENYGEVD
jgi:hypothetical protein